MRFLLLYQQSHQAFETWSKFSVMQRVEYIKQLRLLIVKKMDEIAKDYFQRYGKSKNGSSLLQI